MNKYEPSVEPDAEEGLGLPESARSARNDLVREYHANANEPVVDAIAMHPVLHAVVENQIAKRTVPVRETVNRLMRQGLDRQEAIHAVAAVLSTDIAEIMNHREAEWDLAAYRRKLEKLTANRWRKWTIASTEVAPINLYRGLYRMVVVRNTVVEPFAVLAQRLIPSGL